MSDLFVYYKNHEKKGRWKCVDADRVDSVVAGDEDVGFYTILALNESPGRSESVSEEAKYSGPFYIDIDSDDLKASIKAAKKVVDQLTKSGVPESAMRLWATGKRGFHILIPQSVFTDEVPITKLPLIYKQMALAMKLPDETDLSVYSCGRGRMWRVENRRRIDNGMYKVPITLSELRTLDDELYIKLCEKPRTIKTRAPTGRNSFLEELFRIASARAAKARLPDAVFIDPLIKDRLSGTLPPCMEDLKNAQNLAQDKGFNDFSLQYAKGVAAFAERNESADLIDTFARNIPGVSYGTAAKRRTHTNGAYKIACRRASYEWSCASILSVLDKKPCSRCKIKDDVYNAEKSQPKAARVKAPAPRPKGGPAEAEPMDDQNDPTQASFVQAVRLPDGSIELGGAIFSAEEAALFLGDVDQVPDAQADTVDHEQQIFEAEIAKLQEAAGAAPPADPPSDDPPASDEPGEPAPDEDEAALVDENFMVIDDCMCFLSMNGIPRRVSNFSIQITELFLEFVSNIKQDRRVAVRANIFVAKKCVGNVIIDEQAWNSKAAFVQTFSGLSNLAYYGKEDDVQRIKSALLGNMNDDITNIRRVYYAGIVHQRVGQDDIFTYVEPGWSIDSAGFENLYSVSGKLQSAPDLKNVPMPGAGDVELRKALSSIMKVNQPYQVALLLGWYMAAYLVEHIFTFRDEFPLLNINGQAGAGKTQTAGVFAFLNGLNYFGPAKMITVSTTTEFPIWSRISSSTTLPAIFEEFNKHKMPKTYDKMAEYFKGCWNRHTVTRGTIHNLKQFGNSRTGASNVDMPQTAPIVLLSEQSIQLPALRERVVSVNLSKRQRSNDAMEQAFFEVKDAGTSGVLMPFAKAATFSAISLPIAKVKEWLAKWLPQVPRVIDDRPRYSFAVVLAGLEFFQHVCDQLRLGLDDQINQLRSTFMDKLLNEETSEFLLRQQSEIDHVLAKMGVMAALSTAGGQPWLEKRRHYFRTEQQLVLDITLCHAMYLRYMRMQENAPPVIESPGEFLLLIKNEPYFISATATIDGFAKGRPVLQLSTEEMKKKGLDPSHFELIDLSKK